MYIAFDIGGTHTRIAFSENGKTIDELKDYPTPLEPENGILQLINNIHALTRGKTVRHIVGGFPGILNKNIVLTAPNLPKWIGVNLVEELSSLAPTVEIYNDTALGGIAEASRHEQKFIAYISIGTGIGGVRIVNGKFDQHHLGFEPGHQLLDGIHTWEELASGKSINNQTGKHASEIDDPEFWNNIARWVAVGLHNIQLTWTPELIVLGGGLINRELIKLAAIESEFSKLPIHWPEPLRITRAHYGDLAGIYGGLKLCVSQ